jgi:hypothetical protein
MTTITRILFGNATIRSMGIVLLAYFLTRRGKENIARNSL